MDDYEFLIHKSDDGTYRVSGRPSELREGWGVLDHADDLAGVLEVVEAELLHQEGRCGCVGCQS